MAPATQTKKSEKACCCITSKNIDSEEIPISLQHEDILKDFQTAIQEAGIYHPKLEKYIAALHNHNKRKPCNFTS